MTQRRPPRLARWLLFRTGVSIANAPLAGDLYEEFQNGRSFLWFWRQTFTAVWENGRLTRRNLREWKVIGYLAHLCLVTTLWSVGLPREGHAAKWLLLLPVLMSIGLVMAMLDGECGYFPVAGRLAAGEFGYWTLAYLVLSASHREPPVSFVLTEGAWLVACIFDPIQKINRKLKKRFRA